MFESFGSSVEFLGYTEFKEWLKKYNLTSSSVLHPQPTSAVVVVG